MITYLLPTRDRAAALESTLGRLGALSVNDQAAFSAEVIIIDNASSPPVMLPSRLDNDWPLMCIRRKTNEGAAARNIGAHLARGEWIIMLDDDSYPLDTGHLDVLRAAPPDVAAIGADISLPNGWREAGGLPEVTIGCGTAIRREAFLSVDGYDPAFDYYVEEYDLCAKLMLKGWRIIHDRRFRVRHEKITTHRDMNRILHRLVRNNCWVAQRYSPPHCRQAELEEIVRRYGEIAIKENASDGYARGLAEALQTLVDQPARTMSAVMFDRLTGLAHARATLAGAPALRGRPRVAIIDGGKNEWAIRLAVSENGAALVEDEREAEVLVIGTLSPGPMMDAWERRITDPMTAGRPVVRAWTMQGEPAVVEAAAA